MELIISKGSIFFFEYNLKEFSLSTIIIIIIIISVSFSTELIAGGKEEENRCKVSHVSAVRKEKKKKEINEKRVRFKAQV